jgi:hypothetical protein
MPHDVSPAIADPLVNCSYPGIGAPPEEETAIALENEYREFPSNVL